MIPHICPSWCINQIPHPIENSGGYYHDSEPVTVENANGDLIVKVSRYVVDQGANDAVVELQDQRELFRLFTPAEARELAAELTKAADMLEPVHHG